jgi:hypothetical protein
MANAEVEAWLKALCPGIDVRSAFWQQKADGENVLAGR